METGYSIDKIKEFIRRCEWRWAKTYLDIPHEYIARYKCPLTDSEFLYFAHAQRELGKDEWFCKVLRQYLYVDGYKYWTMGNPYEETTVMNRQKVFKEFDLLGNFKPFYTEIQSEIVSRAIMQFGVQQIFDIGCGTGSLIDQLDIIPNNYYGCDPCKLYVSELRKRSGFYRKVTCKAFEELCTRWKKFTGLFVATFGSASYVMSQYLKMIPDTAGSYFLMFYRDDFVPEQFKDMHHFRYSLDDLKNFFPCSYISPTKEYYVVSSKVIDWERALSVPEKQLSLFDS